MNHKIRDVYTSYLSNRVVVTPPANNVEFVAGFATNGPIEQKVSVSDIGTAKKIFGSGALMRAIEERIKAGSTRIYAVRLNLTDALYAIDDTLADNSITVRSKYKGATFNGLVITLARGTGTNYTLSFRDELNDISYNISGTSVADLKTKVNAAQDIVEVIEKGTGVAHPIAAESTDATLTFAAGSNGTMATADYEAAITYSKQFTEVNWVHFLEAPKTKWSAILASCDEVLDSGVGARWAILDLPLPESYGVEKEWTNKISPSATQVSTYLTDLSGDTSFNALFNRNAVFTVGYGKFTDSDGNEYYNQLGSFLSGVRASVRNIAKSTLGEHRNGLLDISRFNRAHQAEMVDMNLNHMRYQPGIGFIWALSNNKAPSGSPYNRIEKMQAVYAAGMQVHTAAIPHLGRPNDEEGEGMLVMEKDLQRPLDIMVKNGEIDSYTLQISSNATQREDGEVEVHLTINSMKAFEFIIQNVYLV